MVARLGTSWHILARLGTIFAHLGAVLGDLGAILVRLGAILGRRGAILGASWARKTIQHKPVLASEREARLSWNAWLHA